MSVKLSKNGWGRRGEWKEILLPNLGEIEPQGTIDISNAQSFKFYKNAVWGNQRVSQTASIKWNMCTIGHRGRLR
jgi:hypothetical protein